MPRKLSLKEALDRQAENQGTSHDRSASLRVVLSPSRIDRPVELARVLTKHGVSLRKAHDMLNRLTAGHEVAGELRARDSQQLASELAALGAQVRFVEIPDVNVKEVREKFGISQAEFAARFGLELDSIQNWEQGRYKNPAATLLLKIIERYPRIVETVLAKPPSTGWRTKGHLTPSEYRLVSPWVASVTQKEHTT